MRGITRLSWVAVGVGLGRVASLGLRLRRVASLGFELERVAGLGLGLGRVGGSGLGPTGLGILQGKGVDIPVLLNGDRRKVSQLQTLSDNKLQAGCGLN